MVSGLSALGCLAAVAMAAPPTIIYANATSQLGARGGTWEHGAADLFDGRDDTAWCVGTNGLGIRERVGVEFNRAIRADRIRIAAGNPVAFGAFGPANRPRVLTISNMSYAWQVVLPDDAEPFELPLPPPFTGSQMVVQIENVYNHGGRHTCLAEVTLFEGRRPIRLAPMKAQRGQPSLEGVWVRIEAPSPETFIVFYRDGRFRHRDNPDMAERRPDRWGRWSWQPDARLRLEVAGDRLDGDAMVSPHDDGRLRLALTGPYLGRWVPFVPETGFASDLF